jgi:ADP-ribosyl-[dinitrogen reductase] hydrolase
VNTETLDRIAGVAVGAALGDALGMPLEFGPIQPREHLVRTLRAGRLPAGSFTDDTEMALALADSLLAHSPLDGDDLAQRFVEWYRAGPPDVGIHTAQVLHAVGRGAAWEAASRAAWQSNPHNAGNGSVMRCWPVALACWQNWPRLLAESALQSRVTHYHPECVAGSVFINAMIALLIAGQAPAEALPAALEACTPSAELREVILEAPYKQRGALPNSGWVRHTLETAVWGLLTTQTFEEALVQTANLGGDADTAAAVTGALAGARYGLAGIPAHWREQLQGIWPLGSGRRLNVDDFIRLARSLAGF